MPSEKTRRRILFPLTACFVLSWYFFFTRKSLGLYFDNDDMMNLYFAWSRPLAQGFRPVGGLFYRALYAVAGFDPAPFRAAALVIGALNIGLCGWFARQISGSDRVAALAVLFFAFHSRLMEVWWRTAVVYDLLCFTFFYLAACLYISCRRRGRIPGAARFAAVLISFLCALGSKENAVALPAILVAYEVLFHGIRWRSLRQPVLLAAFDIPYFYLKTRGAGAISANPLYAPEYTRLHFGRAWSRFLGYLFLQPHDLRIGIAVSILFGSLIVAAALRSRGLVFAWIVFFAAALPVTFIPYRGGYVLYVGYAGAAVYAAWCLVAVQDLATRRRPGFRTGLACIVFALAAWRWGRINLHDQRADPRPWLYDSAAQVRAFAEQMRVLQPRLPRGARVLFTGDGFSTDEWTPYFAMKLLYRDDSMVVDRVKMMKESPSLGGYGYVFGYRDGRYEKLKP